MKKRADWLDTRIKLSEIVPLKMPINITVEPTRACNFKCKYCLHANSGWTGRKDTLSKEMFDRFIEAYDFNEKIKSISFAGLGEPLINKYLPYMISASKKIANETILVTNGSLLNKENADKLLEAELDRVRISLQGTSADDYKNIACVDIDFNAFLDNLSYFYNNKKHTEIWVKMPDIAQGSDEKINKYEALFSDKCDKFMTMAIQPYFTYMGMDYSKMKLDKHKTVFNEKRDNNVSICPQPFYRLYLLPNGDIYPCCAIEKTDLSMGNIVTDSLSSIWNGEKFNNFRLEHCTKSYRGIENCAGCVLPVVCDNHKDNIDSRKDMLTGYYSKRETNT